MTLIAGYIINSCPVLIGHVLVSNPKGKGESISTPTWHEAEEAQQGSLQIINMVQKVNTVHDQACFAWAGSYYQAALLMARPRPSHDLCMAACI